MKIRVAEEIDENINKFQNIWGIPQCVGATNGSHIPIKSPVEFHSDHFNPDGCYSVILQAVVENSCEFIDVITLAGRPGEVRDA